MPLQNAAGILHPGHRVCPEFLAPIPQIKKPSCGWHLYLEGHVDQNWNTIYPCLLHTYSKLKHLGFLYLDGEISYPEEVQDV